MADQADVRSLDRLLEFQQQMVEFRQGLLKEIENLSLELRRLTNWLEQEVIGYWTDELVKAQRRWAECRDNLSRCESYVRIDEKRPCTEEKKRLRLAELRLDLCQQKLRISQAALTFWQTERSKQQAHVARCQDLADADMRVASEHLRGQIELLQRYLGLRSTPAAYSTSPDAVPPDVFGSEPPIVGHSDDSQIESG